jgi:predicted DNA-binding transcriptional regulator AlpA
MLSLIINSLCEVLVDIPRVYGTVFSRDSSIFFKFLRAKIMVKKIDALQSEFINEKQVAEILEVSYRTVQDWRFKGRGPRFQKFGGAVRYSRTDIEGFVKASLRVPSKRGSSKRDQSDNAGK